MSLCTKMYEGKWQIEINKETWYVDTIKDALNVMNYLMDGNIKFSVEYSFELVHIVIPVERRTFESLKEMKDVLDNLIEFKDKYGISPEQRSEEDDEESED